MRRRGKGPKIVLGSVDMRAPTVATVKTCAQPNCPVHRSLVYEAELSILRKRTTTVYAFGLCGIVGGGLLGFVRNR